MVAVGVVGRDVLEGGGGVPPPLHMDSLGQPTPGVVKQDKSSRGSVDTTKTRSGPQRVRMSSGERPTGAAKGKQSDTEALCQTPPSTAPSLCPATVPLTAHASGNGTCNGQ